MASSAAPSTSELAAAEAATVFDDPFLHQFHVLPHLRLTPPEVKSLGLAIFEPDADADDDEEEEEVVPELRAVDVDLEAEPDEAAAEAVDMNSVAAGPNSTAQVLVHEADQVWQDEPAGVVQYMNWG